MENVGFGPEVLFGYASARVYVYNDEKIQACVQKMHSERQMIAIESLPQVFTDPGQGKSASFLFPVPKKLYIASQYYDFAPGYGSGMIVQLSYTL